MKKLKDVELYLVIDREICDTLGVKLETVTKEAVDGGIDLIQYRDKVASKEEYKANAAKMLKICRSSNVPFLVNDYVDVAKEINSDGIHVGQSDATPTEIRESIGNSEFIIGYSTHDDDEIAKALSFDVSYFNIGPIFHTKTKRHLTDFIGTDLVSSVSKKFPDTIFTTMGGINQSNVKEVIIAGADRVAVVTAIINNKKTIKENIQDMKALIHEAKEERV